MTEDKIAERLKQGDEAALGELAAELSPLVTSVVYNLSRGSLTASDIEEITADAFIALWYGRDKIIPGRLKGFLLTVAKNKARDRLRRIKDKDVMSLDDEKAQELSDGFALADEFEKNIDAETLRDALAQLGDKDREIIVRHYYYYQTSTEIGELMGMTGEAVKKRIARGREKLKKILEKRGASE